jgi:Uncharacterized protein conserved in bacteria
MEGEKDITRILQTLNPVLNDGNYVFCTTKDLGQIAPEDVVMTFCEREGTTIILEQQLADKLNFKYSYIARWITLSVHSALEAVGLTATFSQALAHENISCNVVAGFYHDHIFVDEKEAKKAMTVLRNLSKK